MIGEEGLELILFFFFSFVGFFFFSVLFFLFSFSY